MPGAGRINETTCRDGQSRALEYYGDSISLFSIPCFLRLSSFGGEGGRKGGREGGGGKGGEVGRMSSNAVDTEDTTGTSSLQPLTDATQMPCRFCAWMEATC